MPTANEMITEHGVQKFYDAALPVYEKIMGEHWHHGDPEAVAMELPRNRACQILEERIASLCGLGLKEKELVLDFGSGIGGPTRTMARYTLARQKGATFTGVCNNDRLTQRARALTAEADLPEGQVSFLTIGDTAYKNLSEQFPRDHFDAVTFFESVCHIPDKAALFHGLARVLKPGGRLGGMDWIKRPFGENQTQEQILPLIEPIHKHIAIPGLGTVEEYKKYMTDANLKVFVARDLYPGTRCWSATQTDEHPQWLGLEKKVEEMFREGEKALVKAREEGVFSIGMWVARKPA